MTLPNALKPMTSKTLQGLTGPALPPVTPLRRRLAGLTAGALALSVVLASGSPVRADDTDDLLAALAALAVIGVIINEAEKDRHDAPVTHPAPVHPAPSYHPPRPPVLPLPPRPVHSPRIPAICAIEVERRDHRDVVVYSENCLDRYGIDRLPDRCAREIKAYGRRDWVYGEACLREAGYRFERDRLYHHERPD